MAKTSHLSDTTKAGGREKEAVTVSKPVNLSCFPKRPICVFWKSSGSQLVFRKKKKKKYANVHSIPVQITCQVILNSSLRSLSKYTEVSKNSLVETLI